MSNLEEGMPLSDDPENPTPEEPTPHAPDPGPNTPPDPSAERVVDAPVGDPAAFVTEGYSSTLPYIDHGPQEVPEDAVSESQTEEVHVGEASEDRPQVDEEVREPSETEEAES